jgi:steroid 5-alpha reductase family enzyme
MNAWLLTGVGLNLSAAIMIIAWIVARKVNNAGILETTRPLILLFLAIAYALLGEGIMERRLFLALLVVIASTKDLVQALRVIRKLHPTELPSYQLLRQKFPQRPWLMFFGYYQIQGVLTALLTIPLALICSNTDKAISPWEIAGLVLWVAALVLGLRKPTSSSPALQGEDPEISGTTVAYNRIPFPWLAWISYCLMAVAAPGGIWGIISLLLICFLLK